MSGRVDRMDGGYVSCIRVLYFLYFFLVCGGGIQVREGEWDRVCDSERVEPFSHHPSGAASSVHVRVSVEQPIPDIDQRSPRAGVPSDSFVRVASVARDGVRHVTQHRTFVLAICLVPRGRSLLRAKEG